MGSVVNTRQLSRCTKSFSFLLSLAALCCVRRWQGSPSCFLSARAPPPPPCRLLPSAMCYLLQPLSPAQGGRGEPSLWTGWNPKEQFSRPPSRGKLKENLCNKTRRVRRLTGTGREGSSSTGSPPPPSPPPPPLQPPLQCQAHSAHRTAQTYVDRFESKNLEYFPPCSNCLTDMFLLPFISIQVLTLNSTNMCKQNIETGSFKQKKKKKRNFKKKKKKKKKKS